MKAIIEADDDKSFPVVIRHARTGLILFLGCPVDCEADQQVRDEAIYTFGSIAATKLSAFLFFVIAVTMKRRIRRYHGRLPLQSRGADERAGNDCVTDLRRPERHMPFFEAAAVNCRRTAGALRA